MSNMSGISLGSEVTFKGTLGDRTGRVVKINQHSVVVQVGYSTIRVQNRYISRVAS